MSYKKTFLSYTILIMVGVLLFHSLGWGGNPLVLPTGKVLHWPTKDISFHIDKGPLGPYPNKLAKQWVLLAFEKWSEIPHLDLNLQFEGTYDEEITYENYHKEIKEKNTDRNPIIFDDGSIIEWLRGEGASTNYLGLTIPFYHNSSGEINRVITILNGKQLTGTEDDLNRIMSTMLHEFGHFFGLDHSQLYPEFAFDTDPSNNLFLPVMFPIETEDQISPASPSQDDKTTLQSLYPLPSFQQERGSIQGTVMRPAGDVVQGANVVAVNIDKPYVEAYATISDLMIEFTGEFVFEGLPPGWYEVYIEPLNQQFMGVSRVGPFSEDELSPSFINPVTKEYYNGSRENGYMNVDDPMDRVFIEVNAGETVTDIDFITNEETNAVNCWDLY